MNTCRDIMPPGVDMEDVEGIDEWARARAIRAVVAAQWATACVMFCPRDRRHDIGISLNPRMDFTSTHRMLAETAAALPTAEQIVDGVA